ncbi:uncharacterized protein LOC112569255 [Pomacea canaliculata]|uniref:uncharacterized protein LOC112569255 n=1 Tax=Pomacea canaliculata TaxID=400727 RepID=UPI000D730C91|nr:uncharacterized protein LOC112569255 [Pomacea canaliculata]
MSILVHCYTCLLLVAMVTQSVFGSNEMCTVIEFHEFSDGDIVKVQQNSFFDATFYLNASKCRHSPDFFRVKVLYSQENFSVDVCNVIFQHHICHITDMSSFCFCKNDSKKSVRLYREFKVSGNVSYIWKLSESPYGHVQKKAQITFDVVTLKKKKQLLLFKRLEALIKKKQLLSFNQLMPAHLNCLESDPEEETSCD